MPSLKAPDLSVVLDVPDVILSWTVTGKRADSFRVFRNGTQIGTTSSTTLTYTDSAVAAGTYSYQVEARLASSGIRSNVETLTVASVPVPTTASVLSATSGSTQVSLSWTAVASADSYELQRKTGAGSYSEINDANVLTYLDTGRTNGTVYTYRVRGTAHSGADVGPWSNEVAKTPSAAVPVAPTLTGIAGDSENGLDWNSVANAATYRLRRVSNGVTINFPDTAETFYVDDTVTNGTSYQYAVRGIASDGTLGSLSAPVDLVPRAAIPPTVDEDYLIIGKTALLALSTGVASYTAMKSVADQAFGTPDLSAGEGRLAGQAIAAALVFARTGQISYRDKVKAVLVQVPTSSDLTGATVLPVARQIAGYVIAADLIGYREPAFVAFMSDIRTRTITGHTRWTNIRQTSNDTANNWGAWAMSARVAASLYVGDTADVAAAVTTFKGFLGDHSYTGYRPTQDYDSSWACDPYPANTLVGINRDCGDRNGAVVDDICRSAGSYPAIDDTGRTYSWESLGGALLTARLLKHNGYADVHTWQSNALRRAAEFMHSHGGYPPLYTVNQWMPHEINAVYSLSLSPISATAGPGREFGFTDWLNGH